MTLSKSILPFVFQGVFWAILARAQAADKASDYLETSSAWMSSTLDARSLPRFSLKDNCTIRGMIFRLGQGAYGCFDTDLLRWSVVWQGDFIRYRSMATQSYFHPGQKNSGGQEALCSPSGQILTVTGLHPGGFLGRPQLVDPRPAGPDPRDLGRGPIDGKLGAWLGVRQERHGAVLAYRIGATRIEERGRMRARGQGGDWLRFLKVGPHDTSLCLVLGSFPGHAIQLTSARDGAAGVGVSRGEEANTLHFWARSDSSAVRLQTLGPDNTVVAHLAPTTHASRIRLFLGQGNASSLSDGMPWFHLPREPLPAMPWPETVTTAWEPVSTQGSLIQERLPLPEPNPWKRKVRSSAMAFGTDGSAWVTTFDGDVWRGTPLDPSGPFMRWRRIAAGLHEPMSVVLRDGAPFIFTRNGIILLKDQDGNGMFEEHVNFCNQFTQSAETREFANDMILANDGSFYIAKGGQQITFQGIDNGRVLRISPDGREVKVVARGLRQPFLGYSREWDMLTASDQQGHWVPTTALHWIREGHHYGFRPGAELVPPSREITPPLCWIPHRVVQSAAGQVWMGKDGMGELNGRMVCLDYYRPRLVTLSFDRLPFPRQAAVIPLPLRFDTPLLKAVQHPENHWLHLVGFRIWGSNASKWAGILRLRPSGQSAEYPVEVKGFREGVMLRFSQALETPSAANPSHYSVLRWNYKRSSGYGSGYYKRQGGPGTEQVQVQGAHLSQDRRSVFLSLADPQPIMQMEVVYRIKSQQNTPLEGSAYLTFHHLPSADWQSLGFEPPSQDDSVVPEPILALRQDTREVSVLRGRALYQSMGCMACHSTDGTTDGRVGPSFAALIGRKRTFVKGAEQIADEAYIRESILDPARKVVQGHAQSDVGMPSYAGVLNPSQVDSLVAFIKSL
ncbi:MAG: cytochrome c [Verrucomicrobiota bacterium]|nr:cytochrome c [Verrucomicrobiota bacterium]